MSYIEDIKDIDKTLAKKIAINLCLEPEENTYLKHKKKKSCVIMMTSNKTTMKATLPFHYSCSLHDEHLNKDKEHLKIFGKNGPSFELELRSEQVEYAEDALKIMKDNYGCVIIGLPPASGKTILGIYLAYRKKLATCILITKTTLMNQWVKTISMCVPEYKSSIWIVGEHIIPDGEYPTFTICMNERFNQIPEYIRKSIGTIIIDEAHLFCTPSNVECLLYFEPRYIISETATLERDDGMHRMINLVSGDKGIFKISTKPYNIYKVETGCFVEEFHNVNGLIYGKLMESLSLITSRNQIAINIVQANPTHKYIILTKLKEHVEELERMFNENEIKCDTLYGLKKKYTDKGVLIGTIPKMGTGFDEKTFSDSFNGIEADVLILMLPVKSWQLFEQIRGRVMRADIPSVIWLWDKNTTCKSHFKILERKWFIETNAVIITVDEEVKGNFTID